ncbi:hypothetical protein EYF80_062572 [Liparis tanakae]|uniref:Uncharacterized protein n=1 Tax=Liparis tanakae TaxID=230148 RepID=A0A4Z2EFN5_9TELE|nr:hypothetical protein EYF80_062572 [Liparis tanakae]
MVVDAPNSNGPFQPVALMHFRGTYGRVFLPVLSSGVRGESEPCRRAPVPLRRLVRGRPSGSASRCLRVGEPLFCPGGWENGDE